MKTLQIFLGSLKKCDEHGVWDSLPCPWPECPNGHDENQFQVASFIQGEAPKTYTRKEWISPLAGSYYSWDSDDLPNWFSTKKTFWNEARRLGLLKKTYPKLIYHYTSLDGFVGIVRDRAMWLTDYSYLNDTREISHGRDMIQEVATEMLQASPEASVASLLKSWISDVGSMERRVWVASFSADDDSLSQWRAYGPIAVGFVPQDIAMHALRGNVSAVEYDREAQRKLVSVYLHHLCQAYAVDTAMNRLERITDVYHKIDQLIELIAFFKDPSFSVEHEYRLAYFEYPDMIESFGLEQVPKHFRVSRSRLLPYVRSQELEPVPLDERPLKIAEVVLGPEADQLLERGVKEFLSTNGLSEVPVRRSTVPYRT